MVMFQVIQSNDTNVLLDELIAQYRSRQASGGGLGEQVFEPFTVIVPSMVLADWVKKSVAQKLGISTLFTAQFWGQYQWQMIQTVLQVDAKHYPNTALQVPEVAMLSASVMRWRLFGFLWQEVKQNLTIIQGDDTHPLHDLYRSLYDDNSQSVPEHRLWQVAAEISGVYVRYLTHRPEWLHAWTHDLPLAVSVEQMLQDKAKFADEYGNTDSTPDWLIEQYVNVEKLLRFLWHRLFAMPYAYRESLEERFWAVLDGRRGEVVQAAAKAALPQKLYLFTVQQIPQIELLFLKHLSVHLDIVLFHANPSKMFWADIVDKNWLATQTIIRPDSIYLKDYGHSLLSRLAKESRETFAMLVDMSGGEFYYEKTLNQDGINSHYAAHSQAGHWAEVPMDWRVDWQDKFVPSASDTLLGQLKNDILMLDEGRAESFLTQDILQILQDKKAKSSLILNEGLGEAFDNDLSKPSDDNLLKLSPAPLASISIHACHSLKRQLELARVMIARYLNELSDDGRVRQLSDVVVYVPDIELAKPMIQAVFDDGVGADGLRLPAKITGTTNPKIDELMQAILGFYRLLGEKDARFYQTDVFEWLLNPMLYQSFGLDFDEMSRACELLELAGFKRGFDAMHLAQTLSEFDTDYRYSFAYALDRIVAGLVTPDVNGSPTALFYPFDWQDSAFGEAVLPLGVVTLADQKIVTVLCQIYAALSSVRGQYSTAKPIEYWLCAIENDIIAKYFGHLQQTAELRAIFEAKNRIAASIRANRSPSTEPNQPNAKPLTEMVLSLQFVLESIASQLSAQAVSAEPAQVITFARFGALRSIPFALTIMLEMNLSEFPRQDKNARLDLMRAGLRRRGDRLNEDDDNGAFLDAILCSRDACAIFYTAVAKDGVTELLPAAPVSELLEFFKGNVLWRDVSASASENAVVQAMPMLVERYLLTQHLPTGFDEGLFYKQDNQLAKHSDDDPLVEMLREKIDRYKQTQQLYLPPPPLWQAVRAVLDAGTDERCAVVDLPSDHDYAKLAKLLKNPSAPTVSDTLAHHQVVVPTLLKLSDVYQAFKSPAKHFLRGKILLIGEQDESLSDEPLALDGLGNYQVFDAIIKSNVLGDSSVPLTDDLQKLWYSTQLPAGAMRFDVLDEKRAEFAEQVADFWQFLQAEDRFDGAIFTQKNALNYLNPCDEKLFTIMIGGQAVDIQTALPTGDGAYWLSILPNKARESHQFRCWLQHLAWQVVRKTDDADVQAGRGGSFWRFFDHAILYCPSITQAKAEQMLGRFVITALMMEKFAIPLTPKNSLIYARLDDEIKANPDGEEFAKAFKEWTSPTDYQGVHDDNPLHESWQLIVPENARFDALKQALFLVDILYSDFNKTELIKQK
ncbi:exodeoxyribonuclease V subunit gamma [Moraxella nasibovis]|uniref:exodeoxyribonuclease V subunit gamma n=1 Tax=Moraxella nasibovis TaxID=2904120 RepID=UPI00240ECFEA|nr:exodeoxyribonuclease V subunit gamma [Moraxella nasibovis]WFF37753.1 exodeoxyribonuclease V subunit gamma [Moraxella nasibovis]